MLTLLWVTMVVSIKVLIWNYVEAMKDFCQQADAIIPNLTEASLLTDSPYLEVGSYDKATVDKLLRDLTKLGPRKVVLTGISFEDRQNWFGLF